MKPLNPLRHEQARAVAPTANAWVSASAGTGKTQVLSARVLRLLLQGAAPDRILCLTFTKAGAAEMQTRIFERLAHWVRASDAELTSDLKAILAEPSPETMLRARTLFAYTLDARGGLNVQTLHGYAQSLLAGFPVEAGVSPGFATLAERDALALRGRVLAEAIEAATRDHDRGFLDDVGQLSISRGEQSLDRIASTLIRHQDAIAQMGPPSGFEVRLRRAFGLPGDGTPAEVLGAQIARLDHDGLRRLGNAWEASGLSSYGKFAENLLCWLLFKPEAQAAQLDMLCDVFHTGKGERRATLVPGGKKADPAMVALADTLCEQVTAIAETRRLLDATTNAARHLRVGARLGGAYAAHKRRAGVIDYDDMIARAADLLTRPGMSDWVRFKLDSRIDHMLVDEAQDTNLAQWEIVGALTDEFFDGSGAREIVRTLFVVGDFKQAIFSFQGTDPRIFDDRQGHFRDRVRDADLDWRDIALSESFRSVPAVLQLVDKVVEELGHNAFGTPNPIPPLTAHREQRPGYVTLWPPLGLPEDDADLPDTERQWLPPAQVRMAHQLAKQIAAWLHKDTALWLPARGRVVRPEDILVLVRNRGEFVQPLVAALHDFEVPVAGADRLRLTEPLAVQDLLALVRFALQPGDDLTCATLLTSPFIGMDHDTLYKLAKGRVGRLWDRVRPTPHGEWLRDVLTLADFSAPYEFLETILSGPLQGRAKLLARLGEEARDAVQAVLAQALAFEAANAPTLQGFLAWMEGEDTDLKRDPDAPVDAVRIMTVHGAKGLQAPVVILADAARAPNDRGDHVLVDIDESERLIPIFHGGSAGKVGLIADAANEAEKVGMEEHWRLLYVALTRAEDLLFVGGALPPQRGEKPPEVPEESWYAKIEAAMSGEDGLGADAEPDAIWGEATLHRAAMDGVPQDDPARPAARGRGTLLPAWVRAEAPVEARPSRPLSPSAIAADDIAMPPPTPAMQAAARRGQLLHSLFERLPEVALADRPPVAARWLASHASELTDAEREAIATTVLGVIATHADLFGSEALAEAPIAAVVEGVVIAGKVDRLLVGETAVRLVDFKTGRRVPADAASVETYYLKQMAAYVAALRAIFPGRKVAAALLYTHDATLIDLPAALLAAHAPQLGGREETLPLVER